MVACAAKCVAVSADTLSAAEARRRSGRPSLRADALQVADRRHQHFRLCGHERHWLLLREQRGQPSNRQSDELLDGRLAERGRAGEDAAVDTYRPLARAPQCGREGMEVHRSLGGRSIRVELSMKF